MSTSAGCVASSMRLIPTGRASGLIVAEPGVGYRIAEAEPPT